MTLKQYIYAIKHELKINSDDLGFHFSNRLFAFKLHTKRAFLIKQKFTDSRKQIPESLKQTICMPLSKFSINSTVCTESILKSTSALPEIIDLDGRTSVEVTTDINNIFINFVPYERFKYVGDNKYLKNQVYVTLDSNNYLLIKSMNNFYKLIDNMYFTGLFLNPEDAYLLDCENTNTDCDIYEMTYPITGQLGDMAMQLITKPFKETMNLPNDNVNNAQETPRT